MSSTYEGRTRNEGADILLNSVLDVDISNLKERNLKIYIITKLWVFPSFCLIH